MFWAEDVCFPLPPGLGAHEAGHMFAGLGSDLF